VSVTGVAAASQAVTYTAPAVSAGQSPITTTCSPESGAGFPLGTTTVSCGATDAMARQASCSFKVTLKGLAIAAKTFDAIGDSITIGENGERRFVDGPNAYPTQLQLALESTYPAQGVVVLNHGDGGKRMDAILSNLLKYVPAEKPDAVLLEGGYNDLLGDCGNGPTNTALCREAIQTGVPVGFRDLIRKSKEASRNVQYVFVMTLTPPGPVEKGARDDRRISNDAIVQTNARIKQVVAAEGAVLVDVYPLFQGHEAEYVDTDGLHMRPTGYQVIANAFFAAIQKTIAQTPLFGFTAPR
jgi:lysophospholipase L1-like esterase